MMIDRKYNINDTSPKDDTSHRLANDIKYILNNSATASKMDMITLLKRVDAEIKIQNNRETEAEELANLDSLTGLTNRRYFYNKITTVLNPKFTKKDSYGLLFIIDIDNFKRINDSLGHQTGDECLCLVSERLASDMFMLEGDVSLSRLGGDEFAFIIGGYRGEYTDIKDKALTIAKSILNKFDTKMTLNSHQYTVQVSIGVNVFSSPNTTVKDIIKEADLALYEAKRLGKNQYYFFEERLQQEVDYNLNILNQLQNDTIVDVFIPYYQPIFNLKKEIIAVEALIRWKDNEGMVHPASKFIEIIERSASLILFNKHVFEQVCIQLRKWQTIGFSSSFTHVSINISPVAFMDEKFIEFMFITLDKYNINPHYIVLEITEHSILNDFEVVKEKMKRLQQVGINFSLDDFGTGYSSLSYIHKLPFSELKIDRSFIRDITENRSNEKDEKLLLAIIAMAKLMELSIVAEGIENATQFDALSKIGCDFFQGYYLDRPQEAKAKV